MPDVTVEIAFNAGYLTPAASRVWTDVTDYVEFQDTLTIGRGRADELAEIPPSRLTLTLDNKDGRFTPSKTTGAYYPNVKKGRPIRVRVTLDSGEVYDRFLGYVDEWPVEWPNGTDTLATVTITASSRTARLAVGAELRSIVEEEYLLDSPTVDYPLGEPSGTTTARSIVASADAALVVTQQPSTTGGTIDFGSGTGPGTDGLTAPVFTPASATAGKYLRANLVATWTAVRVECFFLCSVDRVQPLIALRNSDSQYLHLYLQAGGTIRADLRASDDVVYSATSSGTNYIDGATHHVTAQMRGGVLEIIVDGAVRASAVTATGLTLTTTVLRVGTTSDTSNVFAGTLAHVSVGTTNLSTARASDHWTSGMTGFAGESSDARIKRLASYARGITVTAETGLSTTLSHVDTTGKTPIALMRQVAETESGVLFDGRDGNLIFHARSHRYNKTAGFSLSIARQEVEAGLALDYDDQYLANDITASRAGGPQIRAEDSASVTEYGPYRETLDLITTSDLEVEDAANWAVRRSAEIRGRIDSVSVNLLSLASDPYGAGVYGNGLYGSDLTLLFKAEIGDRFTLEGLPSQAAAASQDFFIEGAREVIGFQRYEIAFNVSPASLSGVWALDSALYSQLDSSTILAY